MYVYVLTATQIIHLFIIEINFPFLTLCLIIRVIQNFRPNNDKRKYLKC